MLVHTDSGIVAMEVGRQQARKVPNSVFVFIGVRGKCRAFCWHVFIGDYPGVFFFKVLPFLGFFLGGFSGKDFGPSIVWNGWATSGKCIVIGIDYCDLCW